MNQFTTGTLVGEQVSIPVTTMVTGLGVIGNPSEPTGIHGILAFYTDSGGLPSQLKTQSNSDVIRPGNNMLAVTPVTVPAGTYWIMGEYDATALLCVDTAATNTFEYQVLTFTATLPSTLTPVSLNAIPQTVDVNYYVIAQE
jgi:hypothetical protein